MAHNNDKDLKNTLEEKIKECKKALERHTSMSHETLQTIDTKLKTLEDRFSDWKKGQGKSNGSDNENREAFYEQYVELQEQMEAGQQRELLFLITLIQIDEYWADEESKMSQKKKTICSPRLSLSHKNDVQEKCLCLRFVRELKKHLDSWKSNAVMDSITQYNQEMGAIENYEFKLLSISQDDPNFSNKMQEEINSLNVHMNDFLFSSSVVGESRRESNEAENCKCRGLSEPHSCKMTSKHANKYQLNSIICSIILNRLNNYPPGCKSDHSDISGKNIAIGNEAEIIDSDLNIGDQRPEDIQNLENQPFTSDALEHPDDPEDIDENVSGFPIHKDTLNENKEKAVKSDTICNVCKKFKIKKAPQSKDELMKQRARQMYLDKDAGQTKLKSYDDVNVAGLIMLRSLTDKLILLKWEILNNNEILGYEVTVENFVKVLKSPSRGLAIIKTNIVISDNSIFFRCLKNEVK